MKRVEFKEVRAQLPLSVKIKSRGKDSILISEDMSATAGMMGRLETVAAN